MKKLIISIIVNIFLISCSKTSVFRMEGPEDFKKYIKANESENWVVVKMGEWEKKCKNKKCRWRRHEDNLNFNTGVISSGHIGIKTENDEYYKKSYETIQEFGEEYLVYVGKWHYVEKIGKNIRLFATSKNGLAITYEAMDENNKNIPYKPLALNKLTKTKGLNFRKSSIMYIKWRDTYGYNAYFDTQTGEIKQAKE